MDLAFPECGNSCLKPLLSPCVARAFPIKKIEAEVDEKLSREN